MEVVTWETVDYTMAFISADDALTALYRKPEHVSASLTNAVNTAEFVPEVRRKGRADSWFASVSFLQREQRGFRKAALLFSRILPFSPIQHRRNRSLPDLNAMEPQQRLIRLHRLTSGPGSNDENECKLPKGYVLTADNLMKVRRRATRPLLARWGVHGTA